MPLVTSSPSTNTFWLEAIIQNVLNDFIGIVHRVFTPRLAIVGAQNHNLTLFATQRGKMRHLHYNWSQKLGTNWTQFKNATGQCFTLHQLWRMESSLWFNVSTSDPGWLGSRTCRNDDTNSAVPATAHCTASSINEERY